MRRPHESCRSHGGRGGREGDGGEVVGGGGEGGGGDGRRGGGRGDGEGTYTEENFA